MYTYKYRASPIGGGKPVTGIVEAYSEYEAVAQIKSQSLIVEKITEMSEKEGVHVDLNEPLWVSDKVLALTASQFAIMLRAGLPMGRIVELIAQQTTDKLMKKILTACAADVAAGYSLAQSLEKNGTKIPAAFIETVRAGEESGSLENCFARLKNYYEKSNRIKRKVRSALTYPAILVVIMVVVVAIVMIKLVPTMLEMFDSMMVELPWPTKVLMAISDFFVNSWPVLLAFLAAFAIIFHFYKKSPGGALTLGRLSMKLPVFGNVSRMNAASQFANTLCVLLSSGLTIVQVISIISKVMDNAAVGKSIGECIMDLESGQRLGKVLKNNEYLPPMLVEMVSIGEEAGALEDTMATIGAYYDEEADTASEKALGMLEPMLTVVMGVVVGFIVLAIYIPMFTMETGTGI